MVTKTFYPLSILCCSSPFVIQHFTTQRGPTSQKVHQPQSKSWPKSHPSLDAHQLVQSLLQIRPKHSCSSLGSSGFNSGIWLAYIAARSPVTQVTFGAGWADPPTPSLPPYLPLPLPHSLDPPPPLGLLLTSTSFRLEAAATIQQCVILTSAASKHMPTMLRLCCDLSVAIYGLLSAHEREREQGRARALSLYSNHLELPQQVGTGQQGGKSLRAAETMSSN